MSAITEAAVIDRIRAVCAGEGLTEVVGPDFSRQPLEQIDRTYRVDFLEDAPIGAIGSHEEARGTAVVEVARLTNDDDKATRRSLWVDARTLIAAIVQDGILNDYAVEDGGRTVEIETPDGAAFMLMRARVPVNFEADLS
jgi:hypothetical protein